jgi:ADP-heptose:LPS heptosyltransferase
MVGPDPRLANASHTEAAARATFLRMPPRKWRLVRALEEVIRLLLPFLPAPHHMRKEGLERESILVVEYWNIGDLAILFPFLQNLRRAFPNARVSLLVNPGLASFLEGQGIVDEFIPVRVPWAQHFSRRKKYNPFSRHWISLIGTLRQLRQRRFDWAISGRMDVRDNFLMWLTGAPRRIGYGLGGGGFLLTDRVAPDLTRPHRADIWLHLLDSLGVLADPNLGQFQLTAAEKEGAESILRARGIPLDGYLIGIHSGARIAIRKWGDDRFAKVAQELLKRSDVHVLWFSDPENPSEVPSAERCHAFSLTFRLFLSVLSRCHLLVCNDSGPMHLANLLAVPVVAVFGSTNPVWFGPRRAEDRIVIRPEFWCRPCFDYCVFDEPHCLRTIAPREVIASVREALLELCAERSLSYAATATREGRRSG